MEGTCHDTCVFLLSWEMKRSRPGHQVGSKRRDIMSHPAGPKQNPQHSRSKSRIKFIRHCSYIRKFTRKYTYNFMWSSQIQTKNVNLFSRFIWCPDQQCYLLPSLLWNCSPLKKVHNSNTEFTLRYDLLTALKSKQPWAVTKCLTTKSKQFLLAKTLMGRYYFKRWRTEASTSLPQMNRALIYPKSRIKSKGSKWSVHFHLLKHHINH